MSACLKAGGSNASPDILTLAIRNSVRSPNRSGGLPSAISSNALPMEKNLHSTEDEASNITLDANSIVKDLTTMLTAVCITPDVVSQTRAHTLQQPAAVMYDKAGKTPERIAISSPIAQLDD
ncbi:hypothetical protein PTNB73_00007 [Pyrenophora teres f. teres]|nr:hypothetical protein HRS9139_01250 [Pyrenophora teres f. teres]KAE8873375.1 hypothetical protein PTNB73_00007 [Pyrenophora teres f. teres]